MQAHWNKIEAYCQPAYQDFIAALSEPARTQQQLLHDILSQNEGVSYLKRFGVTSEVRYKEFSNLVPICDYEDIRPLIEDIAQGHCNTITQNHVQLFEMTGGSTGGPKLIPYTKLSLQCFQKAIYPWIYALLQERPAIKEGKAYFAISPVYRSITTTTAGIPVGAGSDYPYLGEQLTELLGAVLIAPALASNQNLEEWKFNTSLELLKVADLSLISVWSPTFIIELLKFITRNADELVQKMQHINPKRALDTQRAMQCSNPFSVLWPMLDTVSCWMDATSRGFIEELQSYLPYCHLQGKGLLSTEAVITIPIVTDTKPLLAINSNFYEFLDGNGKVQLVDELKAGSEYTVIVTNHSGLYRYNTQDNIYIHAMVGGVPSIEFMGRTAIGSDLCGEKLTEAFLLNILNKIAPDMIGKIALQPIASPSARYRLIIDKGYYARAINMHLPEQLEASLRLNPQYEYARTLGQLAELEIETHANLTELLMQQALKKGKNFGEFKPRILLM